MGCGAGFRPPFVERAAETAAAQSAADGYSARFPLTPGGLGHRLRCRGLLCLIARQRSQHFALTGDTLRSEERRVGKECRARWSAYQYQDLDLARRLFSRHAYL